MSRHSTRSLVERIARALCAVDGHPTDIRFEGRPMWESYLPAARVALAAIAEPDTAMIQAGEGIGLDPDAARLCWSVMHAAAKMGPT